MAIFTCLLFWGAPHDKIGVQNIQGCLFFITMNTLMNGIQNVILIFPEERPCFLREVQNSMYGGSPYFWAKIMSEMPFSLGIPTLFASIVYYVVGLNDINAGYFFMFVLINILVYNASQGYALIISAAFADKQLAVTLTPAVIIPFMLFAGFFVASDNIPSFLLPFAWLSIFKWGYNAFLINQFLPYYEHKGDPDVKDPFNCMWDEPLCVPLSQITNKDGDIIPLWGNIGCLFAIYIMCYATSWIILVCLSRKAE